MKNKITLAIILCLFVNNLFGIGIFKIGLKGGLVRKSQNWNFYDNEWQNENFTENLSSNLGLSFGVLAHTVVSNNYSIQIEAKYSQKGNSSQGRIPFVDGKPHITIEIPPDYNMSLAYLEFPIVCRRWVSLSKRKMYYELGLRTDIFLEGESASSHVSTSIMKSMNFGYLLGVGVTLKSQMLPTYAIGLRVNPDITWFHETDWIRMKNSTLELFLEINILG
ncbi:MAG: outer membrane beta-barrel protein [Candidatus Marinimicrobia bacterium]|nr:outer membrane beta-barrel protein [Candidatus Neomarinimicrobiota bacterium]